MRMTIAGIVALACASLASAEEPGVPADMRELVALGLVERLKTMAPDDSVPEERLRETSRKTVGALNARLAAGGEKTVLARAPALTALSLPSAQQPRLDAMARYFACAAVYDTVQARNGFANADRDARILAATAMSGFTLAGLYLRSHFLQEGGTDTQMEAFLAGPRMQPVMDALQADPKRLDVAFEECRPVVTWLIHE